MHTRRQRLKRSGKSQLVPLFHFEGKAASHALVSLGPSTALSLGQTVTVAPPFTLVLGNSAIDVEAPSKTVLRRSFATTEPVTTRVHPILDASVRFLVVHPGHGRDV